MRNSKEIYSEYEKEVNLSSVSLSKLLGCSVDDPNLVLFFNHLLRSVHLQSEYSITSACEITGFANKYRS